MKTVVVILSIFVIAVTASLAVLRILPQLPIEAQNYPLPQKPVTRLYTPVLLYHHVDKSEAKNPYYVSPEIFESQMKWLNDNGYTVVSYMDFYSAYASTGTLPAKPVVITFDDGKLDQYQNAFPILKKYGFVATFFIPTEQIGTGDAMTWGQVKELSDAGMEIGSHTLDHPYLSKTKPARLVKYEIRKSRQVLTMNLDIPIRFFAYPSGAYNKETADIVKNSGYLSAVTTDHGIYHKIGGDPYQIKRIYVFDELRSFTRRVRGWE